MTTKIIFNANNASQGSEPWISDGTPSGTSLLSDVLGGTGSGSASGFFDLGNGRMVVSANNGGVGT